MRNRLLFCLLGAFAVLGPTAVGQSRLVGAGDMVFDTGVEAEGGHVHLTAEAATTTTLRADGTIAVRGFAGPPPPLPPGVRYLQVAVGSYHSLARRSDGVTVAWGIDVYGSTNVPTPPAGVTYVDIEAGTGFSVGIRSDGRLVGWGDPECLGYFPPPTPGLPFTRIFANHEHGYAMRADGSLFAWGSSRSWTPLPPGTGHVDVAVGASFVVVLRQDGTRAVFGTTSFGLHSIPPLPPGVTYVDFAAGENHALGLRSDGHVVAWGDDRAGQCQVPALPNGTSYTAIAGGSGHSAALRSDGTLATWGDNTLLACGGPPAATNGYTELRSNYQDFAALTADGTVWQCAGTTYHAPPLPVGMHYLTIGLGAMQGAALRSDGQVACWGNNAFGLNTPPSLPPGLTYVALSVGALHNLALRSDGVIAAWGDPGSGALLVPQLPAGVRHVAVDAGSGFGVAVGSDGVVRAWGRNDFGQCNVPPQVGHVTALACGGLHTLALRADGTVTAWGWNVFGQCDVPPAPAGAVAVEIAAGDLHSAVRWSDGTVALWGDDRRGQLRVPAARAGESFKAVDASRFSTTAQLGALQYHVASGSGCAGSAGTARLVPSDTPRIGSTMHVQITRLPENLAILATGFSSTSSPMGPLPLDAAPFGMPGCALRTSIDYWSFLVGAAGTARHRMSIPADASLAGVVFHQQALVLDRASGTPLGAVLSDAAVGRIGD
jgi:alpha-tubulin suppressor-like RCC1 family protein